MLRMTPSCPVYLALGPTDLRNNIDGLLDGLSIEQAGAHKEVLARKII